MVCNYALYLFLVIILANAQCARQDFVSAKNTEGGRGFSSLKAERWHVSAEVIRGLHG
jgi:hypothetical protein